MAQITVSLIIILIAGIFDIFCLTKKDKLIKFSLLQTTALIFFLIYLIDLINSEYIWAAFLIGFIYIVITTIIIKRRISGRIIQIIGFIVIALIIGIMSFDGFERDIAYFSPCWSPDGKEIAFFMNDELSSFTTFFPNKNRIKSRYYFCTMDYNGKIFNIVREININEFPSENGGYIPNNLSWTNKENIIMTGGSPHVDVYKFNLSAKEIQKVYSINNPREINGRAWLSPSGQFLVMSYYVNEKVNNTYVVHKRGLLIYDVKNKMDFKEIENNMIKELHGSYNKNEFSYYEDDAPYSGQKATFRRVSIYDLENRNIKVRDITLDKGFLEYFDGFEYATLSPDRKMNADDVFRRFIKAHGIEMNKRSYIFNIFEKYF